MSDLNEFERILVETEIDPMFNNPLIGQALEEFCTNMNKFAKDSEMPVERIIMSFSNAVSMLVDNHQESILKGLPNMEAFLKSLN